jgi:hypothetical protein
LQAALQQALVAENPAIRALQARVLTDWRGLRSAETATSAAPQRRQSAAAWIGAASLVAAVCAAYTMWLQQGGEASVEELSQVDVLSQLAAGEI